MRLIRQLPVYSGILDADVFYIITNLLLNLMKPLAAKFAYFTVSFLLRDHIRTMSGTLFNANYCEGKEFPNAPDIRMCKCYR
jgi:hypothetical protein